MSTRRAYRSIGFFGAILIGLDDSVDVLVGELVLPLAFDELLAGVDEQDIIRLLALLEDEDADRDARRIEQVRGQADDGVDMPVLEQLGADALLDAAAERARRAAG